LGVTYGLKRLIIRYPFTRLYWPFWAYFTRENFQRKSGSEPETARHCESPSNHLRDQPGIHSQHVYQETRGVETTPGATTSCEKEYRTRGRRGPPFIVRNNTGGHSDSPTKEAELKITSREQNTHGREAPHKLRETDEETTTTWVPGHKQPKTTKTRPTLTKKGR